MKAWGDLDRRYDKPDQLIEGCIGRVLDLPQLRKGSNIRKLSDMINATNQMLQSLPAHGIDVSGWDSIVKFILLSKFDGHLRTEWLTRIGIVQQVPLSELLSFLETLMYTGRYDRLRPHHSRSAHQVSVNEPTKNKCQKCQGDHALFRCDGMRKLSAEERKTFVKKQRLCFKCL